MNITEIHEKAILKSREMPGDNLHQALNLPPEESDKIKSDLRIINSLLKQKDYLEPLLSRLTLLESKTVDAIYGVLGEHIYDELQESFSRISHLILNGGWRGAYPELYSNSYHLYHLPEGEYVGCEKLAKNIRSHGRTYRSKSAELLKKVKNTEIKNEIWEIKAKRMENKYRVELSKNYAPSWEKASFGSPKNRGKLCDVAKLWAKAGNFEKASNYFYRAGPYEWSAAISAFGAKAPDQYRKFLNLRAKYPTGYAEDRDGVVADCYEKLGELEKAIEFRKSSASNFASQEGQYDLHGDPKPGLGAAKGELEKVRRLEKCLKERTDVPKANPVREEYNIYTGLNSEKKHL